MYSVKFYILYENDASSWQVVCKVNEMSQKTGSVLPHETWKCSTSGNYLHASLRQPATLLEKNACRYWTVISEQDVRSKKAYQNKHKYPFFLSYFPLVLSILRATRKSCQCGLSSAQKINKHALVFSRVSALYF